MKKIYALIALIAICCNISCKDSTPKNAATATPPNNESAAAPAGNDQAHGLSLITQSDCNTCHNISNKIIGPSYKDIAAKYPSTKDNISKLSNAVINGGSGSWGSVPMPAHPGLSADDAGKMIGYILSLK